MNDNITCGGMQGSKNGDDYLISIGDCEFVLTESDIHDLIEVLLELL